MLSKLHMRGVLYKVAIVLIAVACLLLGDVAQAAASPDSATSSPSSTPSPTTDTPDSTVSSPSDVTPSPSSTPSTTTESSLTAPLDSATSSLSNTVASTSATPPSSSAPPDDITTGPSTIKLSEKYNTLSVTSINPEATTFTVDTEAAVANNNAQNGESVWSNNTAEFTVSGGGSAISWSITGRSSQPQVNNPLMVGGRITVHNLADLLKLGDGESGTADITYAFHRDAHGYIRLLQNGQGLTIYPTGVESSNGSETTKQLQKMLPSKNPRSGNCQHAYPSYSGSSGSDAVNYGILTCYANGTDPFSWMNVKVKAKRIDNTISIQSGINSEWRVAYSIKPPAYSQTDTSQYLRWVATGESKLPDIQLILKPKEPEHTPTTETPVSNLPETSSTPSQASASQSNAPHKLAATGSTTLNAIILTAILFTAGAVLVIVRRTTQRLE